MTQPEQPQPHENHFQIGETAVKNLGTLLDGNGITAGQVRLGKHETLVHQLPGFISVSIQPDISSKAKPGRAVEGTVAASIEEVTSNAAAKIKTLRETAEAQHQILQEIRKRPDKGFSTKAFEIILPGKSETFSVTTPCEDCEGEARLECHRCKGAGKLSCPACASQGVLKCPMCYGTTRYRKNGMETPCPECAVKGYLPCPQCRGAKSTRCGGCNGSGDIICKKCAKTGFQTETHRVNFKAVGTFALEENLIPPEVFAVVQKIGLENLALKEQGEIFFSPPQIEQEKFLIPVLCFLPVAEIELTILNKSYPATIAGLNAEVLEIVPILDKLIKPGLSALSKISKGGVALEPLMKVACRFKMIRETLSSLSHHKKNYVYQKLIKDYPLILSKKYAKGTVRYGDAAVLGMGKGGRYKGLALGAVLSIVLLCCYFATPARNSLVDMLAQQGWAHHILIADMMVWIAGYGMTLLTIKTLAASAIRQAMPWSVNMKDRGLPAAGREGHIALLTSFMLWIAVAAFASPLPYWLAKISGQ